jgi:hypothetical protein
MKRITDPSYKRIVTAFDLGKISRVAEGSNVALVKKG